MDFEATRIIEFFDHLTEHKWAHIDLSEDEVPQMSSWLTGKGLGVSHHNEIWIIDGEWSSKTDAWYFFSGKYYSNRALTPEACGIIRAYH